MASIEPFIPTRTGSISSSVSLRNPDQNDPGGGIQQRAEGRQAKNVGHHGSGDAHRDEEQHRAEVADDGLPGQRGERELDRREGEGGRQCKKTVGAEVRDRRKRTNDLRFPARQQKIDEHAEWHREQDQRIEDKRREKSPTQVVGLADGSGVDERMHPRLHVARRGTAGHGRGHQRPEQAEQESLLGSGEEGIDATASQPIGDDKKDREIEPGADAARLVDEFKAKDLPELHDLPSDSAARVAGRCVPPSR